MKHYKLIFMILFFYNLLFCESYQAIKGIGFGSTKKEALILAKNDVLSKTIGVLISSKQAIKNNIEVSSKIISSTNGYISKFDIISQTKDKKGTWTVDIKADVTNIIEDILKEKSNLKLIIIEMGLPSFSLQSVSQNTKSSLIENLLLKSLLDYGFEVKDTQNTDYILKYSDTFDVKSLDNIYNIKAIKSINFALDCKLIKKNENSIIFTSNTNSTVAHISEKVALRQAIEKCIPKLGRDIVKGIFKHGIKSNQIDLNEVKVTINNLPYKLMFKLQNILNSKFRTNEFVFDKGYKNNTQIFIIKSFSTSNELSKFLLLSKECATFSFVLEMKDDNNIILKLE